MHCGENGILKGAEYATDKYENKAEQEQNELAKIDDYIQNGRDEINFKETELLKEKVIVQTSTSEVDRNIIVTLKDSIDKYRYLIVAFGPYNLANDYVGSLEIRWIKVDEINNNCNVALNQQAGLTYSWAALYFNDNKTIRIGKTCASNTGRTHFAITSIKGIK